MALFRILVEGPAWVVPGRVVLAAAPRAELVVARAALEWMGEEERAARRTVA